MVAIEILKSLKKMPRQTPGLLAKELQTKPQYVRNVLAVLQELELVSVQSRGLYEITDLGKHLIEKVRGGGS